MAKQLSSITDELKDFITQQKIFFVATADSDGRINMSPKGFDSLRVVGENRVVWKGYRNAPGLEAMERVDPIIS